MIDTSEQHPASPAPDGGHDRFVSIPARTRDEIGELAFYLEQVRKNLLTVNQHLAGSSRTMPSVLRDLREIVQMTERATVQVLDETESMLEEAQALSNLIAEAQRAAGGHAPPEISRVLGEVQDLVDRGNNRVMTIMGALEFQDLISQKMKRAFEVLEEVTSRLGKIHEVVSLGQEVEGPAHEAHAAEPAAGAAGGQDLADEILLSFER
jgi:chemotaxis regulatin CheY-phosphate phosphatase CheZ